MQEEQELIALGWPPDEAFYICRRKRTDGTLAAFMKQQWAEKSYVPECPYRMVFSER